MGVIRNHMLRIGADFSSITKQANKASSSMKGMQGAFSRSCSGMTRAVNGLKSALGALGVAASAAALVSFAKDAKSAYETQIESEARLEQVMRNTIGASDEEIQSIKDLCSAQQELGVIGDEVQLAGAQELGTYVTMTSTLKTLIPVLNDMIAQQYGLSASAESASSIATMLGKVMNGQVSALSRYGYTFDEAQANILKYGTEEERAAVLAEVVSESVGGMNAALAATPSGRLQQVSNTLGDIKENFGQAVTTGLTAFLPTLNAINGVLANMATLANKVAQAIANVFGGGQKSAAKAVHYTAAATGAMDGLTDSTKAAGKAAKELATMGFDTLQKISFGSGSGGSSSDVPEMGTESGGGAITESLEGAEEAAESVGWLESALSRLKDLVGNIDFGPMKKSLGDLKAAFEPLGSKVFSGLKWGFDNVLTPLAHWTLEKALPKSVDVLSSALKTLDAAIDAMKPGMKYLWDEFLKPAAAFAGKLFIAFLEDTKNLLDGLTSLLRGDTSFSDFFGTLSTGTTVLALVTAATIALGVAMGLVTSPVTIVIGVIAAVIGIGSAWVKSCGGIREALGALGEKFSSVFSGIRDTAKTVLNGVIGFIEGVVNGGITGVNRLIGALNRIKFDVPDWVPVIGGKKFGFSLQTMQRVTLPRLADGAVIQPGREFAAILGDQMSGRNIETPERLLRQIYREESGSDEIISLLENILSAARARRTVHVGSDAVGRASRNWMDNEARATGV